MIKTVDLSVRAGEFLLSGANLSVPTGSYCVLMGRTGSGKTTLLEAICGLKRIVSGKILIDGHDVTHLKPGARGIGFVPQDGSLFQTMTVWRHLAFALQIRGWTKKDIQRRVEEMAAMLEITSLLKRKPLGLSGGERQRVALGRALSFHPSILCLDEPLSALDYDTHAHMMRLLKRVQQETGVTALHVTHNILEAEQLADRRLHIVEGEVVEHVVEPDGP
jgi:ABC-type sugar transport system ATPase subunit